MSVDAIPTPHQAYPGRVSEVTLRPRYDSAHVNLRTGVVGMYSLAEEAVVHWFRVRKLSPTVLRDRYGLEFSIIDASSIASGVVSVDDEVVASAQPVGARYFSVKLTVRRGEQEFTALRTRITVVLVRRPGTFEELPEELVGMAIDKIEMLPTAVATHDPSFEARDLDERITNDALGWHRTRTVAMSDCHHRGRMQYAGYLKVLVDLADEFMADMFKSTGALLAERGWTVIMPRVRLRVLADALPGDVMHSTYEVHQVVGDELFDCRFDCHVERDGRRIPVATGILLQAFALADDLSGAPIAPGRPVLDTFS